MTDETPDQETTAQPDGIDRDGIQAAFLRAQATARKRRQRARDRAERPRRNTHGGSARKRDANSATPDGTGDDMSGTASTIPSVDHAQVSAENPAHCSDTTISHVTSDPRDIGDMRDIAIRDQRVRHSNGRGGMPPGYGPDGKRLGRPATWTPEIRAAWVELIIEALESGETLLAFVKANPVGPQYGTVYEWCGEEPTIAARLARAREIGAHAMAEQTLSIADGADASSGPAVNKARLRAEQRKWLAGKRNTDYADRVETVHSGSISQRIEVTDESRAIALASLFGRQAVIGAASLPDAQRRITDAIETRQGADGTFSPVDTVPERSLAPSDVSTDTKA